MKGRRLKKIKDSVGIRPTKERIKEAIFNSLQADIAGSVFLDIFAGSGIMGIEAISRDAKEVIFVDNNKNARNTIRENLSMLNKEGEILGYDYKTALTKLKGKKFDIIFADPPYNLRVYEEILDEVAKNDLLNDDGVVVFEYPREHVIKDFNPAFKIRKDKKYGEIKVTYFIKK